MSVKQLRVAGMSCKHCQASVQDSLLELKGVKSAKVDLVRGTVTVDYDEAQVNLVTMKEKVQEAGYEVTGEL